MDARAITFGDTAMDRLLQWLRTSGEPKTIDELLEKYLEILKQMVTEGEE